MERSELINIQKSNFKQILLTLKDSTICSGYIDYISEPNVYGDTIIYLLTDHKITELILNDIKSIEVVDCTPCKTLFSKIQNGVGKNDSFSKHTLKNHFFHKKNLTNTLKSNKDIKGVKHGSKRTV
jgi:hypothetical protein